MSQAIQLSQDNLYGGRLVQWSERALVFFESLRPKSFLLWRLTLPFAWLLYAVIVNPLLRKALKKAKTNPDAFGVEPSDFRSFYRIEKLAKLLRNENVEAMASIALIGGQLVEFRRVMLELHDTLFPHYFIQPKDASTYTCELVGKEQDWEKVWEDWEGDEWAEFDADVRKWHTENDKA